MPKQPGKHDRDPMSGEVDRLLRQLRPGTRAPTAPGLVSAGPYPHPGLGTRTAPGSPGMRPAAPTAPTARAPRPTASAPTAPGAWGRVALGALLAGALTQWPYPTCGVALGAYLAAALMVLVAGTWAARAAWRARTGLAHVVAILLLFAGVGLGAYQLLPRVGWAPVTAPWYCGP